MSEREAFLLLIHDNEQDTAAAEEWWQDTAMGDKLRVWNAIQEMPDDGVIGIIARLAQLKFGELAEKFEKGG